MPLVTLTVCAYNAERSIEETLDSALGQTFPDFEVLVVDDGSKDRTREIVERLAKRHSRLRYHHQPNAGLSGARNTSLRLAEGRWIAIIDHDDICLPNRLQVQVDAVRHSSDAALIFSDSEHFMDDGTIVRRHLDHFHPNPCLADLSAGCVAELLLAQGNFINSTSAFFRRDLALQVGGFDPRFVHAMDYDFFLRLGAEFSFSGIPQVLSRWRTHPQQLTRTVPEKVVSEVRYILSKWLAWPGLRGEMRRAARLRLFVYALYELKTQAFRSGSPRSNDALKDLARACPTSVRDLKWVADFAWQRAVPSRATVHS